MLAQLTQQQVETYYEEQLNHENPMVEIAGYEYSPAYVFKTVDKEAYEAGLQRYKEYLIHQGYKIV